MARPEQNQYVLQPGLRTASIEGTKIWRVQLTEALAVGGNADAYRVDYTNGAYAAAAVATGAVTVYDPLELSGGNDSGDRLLAYFNTDSERWEVLAGGGGGGQLIKSDYSGTIPAYGLAYCKSFEAATGAIVVDRVGTAFKRDYIVNGGTDLALGDYGTGQEGPLVTVLYDSGTPAVNEGFGPLESTFTAKKGQPCLMTCMGILDAGATLMRCRISEINTLLVKTTGAISTGTDDGGAPATVSSGYDIYVSTSTLSGFSGTRPTCYNYGPAIVTDQWCVLTWINTQFVITPLQCGT